MQKFKTLRTKLDQIEEAQLLEKLSAADPTGKWVSDFVHSDDPKFDGKSKKERIRMALGASYAAKRAEGKIKEEVEELDEAINHLQMAKHHQALAKEHDRISHKAAGWDEDDLSTAHLHQSEDHQDAAKAHLQAHKTGNPKDVKAAKKASKESLNNYTTHLMSSNYSHFYNVTGKGNAAGEQDHKDYNYTKLRSGADAVRKGLKEEVEELDETPKVDRGLSDDDKVEARTARAKGYATGSAIDMGNTSGGSFRGKGPSPYKDSNVAKSGERKGMVTKSAIQSTKNRIKSRLNVEEVEQIDEISAEVAKRVAQARDRSAEKYKLTPTQSRRLGMGDKGGEPDLNAAQALKSAMKRGAKDVYKEEVEELDELSKDALLRYSLSAVSDRAANKEVDQMYGGSKQAKLNIKNRTKGIERARKRLRKEEVEELDELSKSTLASYAKKATRDARMKYATGKDFERHARTSRKPEYKAGAKEWEDKYKSDARRREAGVNKAIDRLAKEEVEIDEGITKDTGWKPMPKERKDEYGNPIKTQNVPKRLARQAIPKKPMKEEIEDKPGIHKVSVTINDKDKDDRDTKIEKTLKVKANNQAAALKIAKSHYGNKGYKVHSASYHGIHEEGKLSSGAKDPCWKGYEMVGTKKKNGKEVPNCVPKK